MSAPVPERSPASAERSAVSVEPSVGQLIGQLSEQTSRLVRDELQLAQTELKATAKHAGVGAGLFGGAGVVALYGGGALVTTVVAVLALVLPLWLSALIVAVVLFVVAGVVALMGKKQLQQASPTPERAVRNVKRDVEEVQEARHHEHTHRS